MEDTYFLEEASIEADSDDGFEYDEVQADDIYSLSGNEGDEDFETVIKNLSEKPNKSPIILGDKIDEPRVETRKRPEVTEDFVRNFLVRMNMMTTLDCFQTEWYELQEKQMLTKEHSSIVPDVYIRNRQLDEKVTSLQEELERYKHIAEKSKEIHVKLRKERDYHRMHHKRVAQEKDKLINEIKRMRSHYDSYEPTLKTLRHKYEVAMKEKMLTKLERDRAVAQIEGLRANGNTMPEESSHNSSKDLGKLSISTITSEFLLERDPKDSEFPPDRGVNPMLSRKMPSCIHLSRTGGYRQTNSIDAHSMGVSGLALHPRKQLLVTVSDDRTWRLWSLPGGENIMRGEGHTDWLSDCDFHPQGTHLATTSGDSTLKIWDFLQEKCVHSFGEHTHAVWGCSWHSCGDFIASCAMDGTSKIWDINSLRCRNTLRGHTDSVNSVEFLPYSNTLSTCSADKSICLWDVRTGLCAHSLFDHMHAVNHVTFNLQGEKLASCDAYGSVKLWDVRQLQVITSLDLGPHPINRVAFDPASSVLSAASNNSSVFIYAIAEGEISSLIGHTDAVHSVLFDRNCDYLVSASSDNTVKIWS